MTSTFCPGIRVHIDIDTLGRNDSDNLHLSYVDNLHSSSSVSQSSSSIIKISASTLSLIPFEIIPSTLPIKKTAAGATGATGAAGAAGLSRAIGAPSTVGVTSSTGAIRKLQATLISYKGLIKEEEYDILQQLMNFGMKGCTDSRVEQLAKYGGGKPRVHDHVRFKYAESLLRVVESGVRIKGISSEEDIAGLQRIVHSRLLRFNYTQKIKSAQNDTEIELIVNEIIENISSLDDPDSSKVISLKDGTTRFCLPGGSNRHVVSYEFIKYQGDKGEEYHFTIHDRSYPDSAVASWMQGSSRYRRVDDKIYGKSSLSIKTSKEALINRKFIESLLRYFKYGKHVPYAEIHLFLITIYKGEIAQSESEPLLNRLFVYEEIERVPNNPITDKQLKDIQSTIATLFKRDRHFHSLQKLPTCVESNSTQFEKQIAPGSVIKALKLYTLQKIQESIPDRLKQLTMQNSHIVCVIRFEDYNTRVSKLQYQQDEALTEIFIKKKEAHLTAKLDGKTPKYLNLEKTILFARNLLNQLDDYSGSEFLTLKNAAKARIETKSNRTRYLVEYNHDIKYYLDLVPLYLRQNPDFMLEIIRRHPEQTNPWELGVLFSEWEKALHDSLKGNEEFILKAIEINPMAFKAASDLLKSSELFIEKVFKINPWAIIYASEKIRNNPKYIAELPAFPRTEIFTDQENLEDQIPEDLMNNPIFQQKLTKELGCPCTIL